MSNNKKREEVSLPEETIAQLRERHITALTISEGDRVWVKSPYRFGTSFLKDITDVVGGGGLVPIDDIEPTPDDPFADYLRRLYFRTDIAEHVFDPLGPYGAMVGWHLGAGLENPLVQSGDIVLLDTLELQEDPTANPAMDLRDHFGRVYHNRTAIKADGLLSVWPTEIWPLWNSFIYFDALDDGPIVYTSPWKMELISLFQPRHHWRHGLETPLIYWLRDQDIEDFDAEPAMVGSGDLIIVTDQYTTQDLAELPLTHSIWKWHGVAHFDPETGILERVPQIPRDGKWHVCVNKNMLASAEKVALCVPYTNDFTEGIALTGCHVATLVTNEWTASGSEIVWDGSTPADDEQLRIREIGLNEGVYNFFVGQSVIKYLGINDSGLVVSGSSAPNPDFALDKAFNNEGYAIASTTVDRTTKHLGVNDNDVWQLMANTEAGRQRQAFVVGFFPRFE